MRTMGMGKRAVREEDERAGRSRAEWSRAERDRVEPGRAERGQAAIEYVGVIVLLIFVALAAIQLGIAAYAVQQAGTASRAAARAATYREAMTSPQTAGEAAVSDWLDVTIDAPASAGDEVTATARVRIPAILPVFAFPDAKRSTTMPLD